MDDVETILIITTLVFGAIGSLILAMLHGLGYNLFGFKADKPGFWKRFIFQVGSTAVSYGVFYIIGELMVSSADVSASILTTLAGAGGMGFLLIIAVVTAAIYHISLGAATFLLGSKSMSIAMKTPIICTAVVFILMALPGILAMFAN
tara:strand:- start:95 stop:538 length:444 start_codon:yes stop_codon:yes gene_type:complete